MSPAEVINLKVLDQVSRENGDLGMVVGNIYGQLDVLWWLAKERSWEVTIKFSDWTPVRFEKEGKLKLRDAQRGVISFYRVGGDPQFGRN